MGLDYIVYNMVYWGWRDIIITSVSLALGPSYTVTPSGARIEKYQGKPAACCPRKTAAGFFFCPGSAGMIIGGGCVRPSTIITGQVWPSRCSAWARGDIAALWMSRPSPSAGGGIPVLLVLAAMIITYVGAGGGAN